MVISIVSPKGGEGKSSVALNLACELSGSKKVLLIDTSFENSLSFFLCRKYSKGIGDVILDRKRVEHTIIKISQNMSLIPCGMSVWNEMSEYERNFTNINLKETLIKVKSFYDFIIFDTDSKISKPLISVMKNSDLNLVVISPSPASVVAFKLFNDNFIKKNSIENYSVLINNMKPDTLSEDFYSYIQTVTQNNIAATIPYDGVVNESIGNCKCVKDYDPQSAFVYNIRKLAQSILNKSEE